MHRSHAEVTMSWQDHAIQDDTAADTSKKAALVSGGEQQQPVTQASPSSQLLSFSLPFSEDFLRRNVRSTKDLLALINGRPAAENLTATTTTTTGSSNAAEWVCCACCGECVHRGCLSSHPGWSGGGSMWACSERCAQILMLMRALTLKGQAECTSKLLSRFMDESRRLAERSDEADDSVAAAFGGRIPQWQMVMLAGDGGPEELNEDTARETSGPDVVSAAALALKCCLGMPSSARARAGSSVSTSSTSSGVTRRVGASSGGGGSASESAVPEAACSWRSAGLLPQLLSSLGLVRLVSGQWARAKGSLFGGPCKACCVLLLWQGSSLLGFAAAELCGSAQARLLALAVMPAGGAAGKGMSEQDNRCRFVLQLLEHALATAGVLNIVALPAGSVLEFGASPPWAASEDASAGSMQRLGQVLTYQKKKLVEGLFGHRLFPTDH